ncbi:nucleotidyltransferase [Candidatus Woesearchaeota archaeon CG08_land_8_20_14_0_20_47_9]|nr:MAG: hypothetical protein AUJ69_00040 [Candidatus Woesearchaeota archaeon CG1_02_47_18]PIN72080.1 MAG: nucleotidyltransferase [Candidatus Woesearchaeota archaeon CG10_big_fil_rev_8_21_14_0_10_47_5]PIO03720.1 MAG: nucleotidyltransferase [Candidatus Woesearchaeota archaeon CG08_land_8_20_14_0_20_47_9]HII30133.1 NTP transferase domain-containing protein [Candidatus Woesearchaeota archaeon]
MKMIIPLAGKGTRLRPHTHSKPKPLLKVAGKSVLGHILDSVVSLKPEEIIFITGDKEEQIKEFISTNYHIKTRFIRQQELLGDGHAISLAADYVKEDLLIIFVDTIFKADLSIIGDLKCDGVVWVREVEDPRRFGVVVLNKEGYISEIIEKPEVPPSKLVNIGLYYVKDARVLFECLANNIKNNITSKGELRLVDALTAMIKKGKKLVAPEAEEWLDCGKPETLLSTNRYLLEHGFHRVVQTLNTVIIPPVHIGDNVKIENSIIGPYVSIAPNCRIHNSIISDSIIDQNSVVENAALHKSLVGDSALIKDTFRRLNVGDNSEIDFD